MKLTDELRAWIGREARYTAPEEVGRASIRYFARAVGDDNPVYTDDGAARAAGYDGIVAPPTFVCETNQYVDRAPDADGYVGHRWDLPVPPGRVVRGGHAYRFGRPLRPDDVITAAWRVADIVEKTSRSGSPMLVVTSEATYTAADGAHLATNTETTIHQDLGSALRASQVKPSAAETPAASSLGSALRASQVKPSAAETPAASSTADGNPTDAGGSSTDLVRRLDSVALVAYAGATWDWYRTHHDAEAAAAVGLPRPIVDGQMLGALLAEHAQELLGPRARIRAMRFRFASMVFSGDTVRVTADEPVPEGASGLRLAQRVLVADRVAVGPAETVVEFVP